MKDQSFLHLGMVGDTYTIRLSVGQEEFFVQVAGRLRTRTQAPTKLNESAMKAFLAKSQSLAPGYRTELPLP